MDKLLMGVNYLYNGNVHSFPKKKLFPGLLLLIFAENSKLPEMSQKGMWLVKSILLLLLWQFIIFANIITQGEDMWDAMCPSCSHEREWWK